MVKYVVYSKGKSGKHWMVERSYTLKSYADKVADGYRKEGRYSKVVKKK